MNGKRRCTERKGRRSRREMPRSRSLVKAFDLIPVVEQVLPDRQKTEVSCISACDYHLYVGTHCGLIIYYQMESTKTPFGKTVFQSKVKGRIQLGSDKRKSVQQLAVVAPQKKLLALVDGFLYVMRMDILELLDTGQRVSRVQCFCLDKSPSAASSGNFEILVAPQRRKQLQLYALSGEKMVHLKDYNIPEPALQMDRDGGSVCVALSPPSQHSEGKYMVINIHDGGKTTDLLNFDPGTVPIVKRTSKGEFLVNAGTFGVIAVANGISNRPPVEWERTPPKEATYIFPYVIIWSEVTTQILIYNLLDQQCVQEIPFPNGRYLGNFSGKLFAAHDRSIYYLPQIPLKEQVNALLEKHVVEEAVSLAETIAAVESSKDPAAAEEYVNEVKQKAGFICFSNGMFSQAEALFKESECDPREVIVLFDQLLPAATIFRPTFKHGVPQVDILASTGQISGKEARKFLIRYLKDIRTTPLALGRREDIDTSLVKLLAQEKSNSLIPYIENHELYLAFEETKAALEKYSCYHALGLLYYYSNQASNAIEIWTKISDGKLEDKDFPGFSFITDFLSKYTNSDLVVKYARWALERDEELATKIFTEREDDKSEVLSPHRVLEYLKSFPVATVSYLEHIIRNKGSKEESFHTRLANYYLDHVIKLQSEGDSAMGRLKAARQKLLGFLMSSWYYRAPELLSRVHDTELYRECAVLYGRMEEHEKALNLLAHKLKDYTAAEEYCRTHSQDRNRQYRQGLYQTLLKAFLRPKDEAHKTLIRPALELLNAHGADFDAAEVLELLPPDWPISTVKAFLMHSLRSSIDTYRTDKIEHSLAKGENIQVRSRFIMMQGDPVVIGESTRCPVCSLPFNDAAFVRYPNGIVTHLKCGRNKTICPVTGTWFSGQE